MGLTLKVICLVCLKPATQITLCRQIRRAAKYSHRLRLNGLHKFPLNSYQDCEQWCRCLLWSLSCHWKQKPVVRTAYESPWKIDNFELSSQSPAIKFWFLDFCHHRHSNQPKHFSSSHVHITRFVMAMYRKMFSPLSFLLLLFLFIPSFARSSKRQELMCQARLKLLFFDGGVKRKRPRVEIPWVTKLIQSTPLRHHS